MADLPEGGEMSSKVKTALRRRRKKDRSWKPMKSWTHQSLLSLSNWRTSFPRLPGTCSLSVSVRLVWQGKGGICSFTRSSIQWIKDVGLCGDRSFSNLFHCRYWWISVFMWVILSWSLIYFINQIQFFFSEPITSAEKKLFFPQRVFAFYSCDSSGPWVLTGWRYGRDFFFSWGSLLTQVLVSHQLLTFISGALIIYPDKSNWGGDCFRLQL